MTVEDLIILLATYGLVLFSLFSFVWYIEIKRGKDFEKLEKERQGVRKTCLKRYNDNKES
jgi:hypothetical protein